MNYEELKLEISSRSISQLPGLLQHVMRLCSIKPVFKDREAALRFVERAWDMGEPLSAVIQSDLIARYRSAFEALEKYKARRFNRGVSVTVDCPGRYCGPGICALCDTCPPDKVAVLLESGNVWWYPLESCEPVAPSA